MIILIQLTVSVLSHRKKAESDATDDTTRFANMSKKFRLGENCDSPINEQLATNVNISIHAYQMA